MISVRRAALDADEARWLREAEALQIWRPLGMVSALDYLERVLGYAPRTAQDRLRVARALGALPQLTAALAGGDLAFSAVRELTRVATPTTEASWIAATAGKNLRQIEELVADHRPGDRPEDPPAPEARSHVVRFELAAETFALLRQARQVLDDEHGTNLPDDPFIAALCSAVLDGAPAAEPTGRAKFQVAVTVCRRCRQGWQEGAGAQIAIGAAAVERAMCDAQHIGSIDGSAPERAYQDIPPSVARLVWRRDGGRCRIPGCRSARGLELHHLVHRADGGGHDALNIVLACFRCHQSHHDGVLTISGTADRFEVHRSGQQAPATDAYDPPTSWTSTGPHVGANRPFQDAADVTSTTNADDFDAASATTSTTYAGARVCAADATTLITGAGDDDVVDVTTSITGTARVVRGADLTTSVANARAHVGAAGAASSVAEVNASGRADVTTSIVGAAGALRGADATRSVANARAHVGAAHATTANTDAIAGRSGRLEAAILHTHAKAALTALGWKPAIAAAAVAAVVAAQGMELTLERLIFESLRRCPVPKA